MKSMSLCGMGTKMLKLQQHLWREVNTLWRNVFGKTIWFDVKVYFFRKYKAFFTNLFSKDSSIIVCSIYLHHLAVCIKQIKHQILPCLLSRSIHNITSVNSRYYILHILCHKFYPLGFVIILPFMAESF